MSRIISKAFAGILSACVALVLFSCNKKTYDYARYPQGAVLKGTLRDGRTMYFIRNNNDANMWGNLFINTGNAIADPISFNINPSGQIQFYKDAYYEGKIKPNKKNSGMVMSLPDIDTLEIKKQTVNLHYWNVKMDEAPVCRAENQQKQQFDSVVVVKNIQYGKAPGYYTSQLIDSIPKGDTNAYKRLILKDIRSAIGKPDSLSLFMDMYVPYDPDSLPKPAFMFIHGGGFFLGDKENQLLDSLSNYLAKRGYIVISIDYRLGTTVFGTRSVEKVIYSGTQDARAALRYITHYSRELGVDPNRIYIGGSSAGAIIALNTAFMDNDELFKSAERRRIRNEFGDINTSGNNLTDMYSIAGVIAMWGAVVDLDIIDGRNAHIPALFFHGTADIIVPIDSGLPYQQELDNRLYNRISENWKIYGSRSMYNHMKKLNMPARFFSFEGYGHEPQRNSDGTYNHNLVTIREQTNNFMYRGKKESRIHSITGNDEVHKNDKIPVYKIENVNNAVIQWYVSGGIIIERTGNTASVLWYDTDNEGKIFACIIDNSGNVENVELLIKLHR